LAGAAPNFVVGKGIDVSPIPILAQTIDNGASWLSPNIPNMPSHGTLTSGACNDHMCVAVGSETNNTPILMQTIDGGKNWERVELSGEIVWLESYAACGDSVCVAIGTNSPNGNYMVQTNDGGASWAQVSLRRMAFTGLLSAIDCLVDFCVAVGTDGIYQLIIQTNDGGLTWEKNDRVGRHQGSLIDVDCNASSCVAVGNKTSWGVTPILVQTDSERLFWYDKYAEDLNQSGIFSTVKCTQATCIAAGFTDTDSDIFAAEQSGANWVPMTFVDGFNTQGYITDISCQELQCFLSGMTVDHESLLLSNVGGVWAPVVLPSEVIPGRLAMVHCDESICFSAGRLNTEAPLLIQSINGGPWTKPDILGMPEKGFFLAGGASNAQ